MTSTEKQRTEMKTQQEQTKEYHEQHVPDEQGKLIEKFMDEEDEKMEQKHDTDRMKDEITTTAKTTNNYDRLSKT